MHYNPNTIPIAKSGNRVDFINQYYHIYSHPLITQNLYPYVYDFDNLYEAYEDCFKNTTKSQEMLDARTCFSFFIHEIERELITHTFKPEQPFKFTAHDPKERTIKAPRFKTRVVQKALIQVIGVFLDNFAVPNSCANIPGKGTLYASDRVLEILKSSQFVLVMDVQHYFPSIVINILCSMLYDLIKDQAIYNLLTSCISNSIRGIDIGSITSQYLANLYLDPLDKLICIILGNPRYCRYMDDFMIGASSYDEAQRYFYTVQQFLWQVLGLTLNSNSIIYPSNAEFEFVGFRFKNKTRYMKQERLENVLATIEEFDKLGGTVDTYPNTIRHMVVNYYMNAQKYTEETNGIEAVKQRLLQMGIVDPMFKNPKYLDIYRKKLIGAKTVPFFKQKRK